MLLLAGYVTVASASSFGDEPQAVAASSPSAVSDAATLSKIYDELQKANELSTGLKIEIYNSYEPKYTNDGKTLRISSELASKLRAIDGGGTLFVAREIAYAENVRAGLADVPLEYFSDRAAIVLCKNAGKDASPFTFNKILSAVDGKSTLDDKYRALKIGASQYVSPSDLARISSNKLRRGITVKKAIDGDVASVSGWKPVMKNVASGVASNIAVYYGMNMASNLLGGQSVVQSAKTAAKSTFTTEFLVGGLGGSAVGGAIGAMVGSLIPVPGASPILAAFISTAPALFGANLGSEVGTNMILDYKKNKKISFKRVWDAMDVSYLVGHSVGMAAGMALGQAFIPIPILGGMIGGIVGGAIGSKVASLFKLKKDNAKKQKPTVSLPWLKNGESKAPAAELAAVQAKRASASSAGQEEIAGAQKKMKDAYQRYVTLLSTEREDSPALIRAQEEYREAAAAFEALGGQQQPVGAER